MKYLFSAIILLISNQVLAYTQCPEVSPQIHINVLDEDPIIKSEKSSKELTKESSNMFSNLHVLGRYNPNVKSNIDALAMYRAHSGQICAKITRLDIAILMNPEILLSKEVKTNECVEKRVINHENLHHQYAKNAIIKASIAARVLAQKIVDKNYQGYSKEEVDKEIEISKESLTKEVKEIFLRNYGESNKIIDNDDNYKREAKICPALDRFKFDDVLKNK